MDSYKATRIAGLLFRYVLIQEPGVRLISDSVTSCLLVTRKALAVLGPLMGGLAAGSLLRSTTPHCFDSFPRSGFDHVQRETPHLVQMLARVVDMLGLAGGHSFQFKYCITQHGAQSVMQINNAAISAFYKWEQFRAQML